MQPVSDSDAGALVPDLGDAATGGVLFMMLCENLSADVDLKVGRKGPRRTRWFRISIGGSMEPGPYSFLGEAAGRSLLNLWRERS